MSKSEGNMSMAARIEKAMQNYGKSELLEKYVDPKAKAEWAKEDKPAEERLAYLKGESLTYKTDLKKAHSDFNKTDDPGARKSLTEIIDFNNGMIASTEKNITKHEFDTEKNQVDRQYKHAKAQCKIAIKNFSNPEKQEEATRDLDKLKHEHETKKKEVENKFNPKKDQPLADMSKIANGVATAKKSIDLSKSNEYSVEHSLITQRPSRRAPARPPLPPKTLVEAPTQTPARPIKPSPAQSRGV